jgi:N-acetylmuramic acid 6-phosphate etherase
MSTEEISPRYVDLELWDNAEALNALYEAQLAAVSAVGPALPAIARAVEEAAPRLQHDGRLIYAGAGTSGRIAVQDGAELAPTFAWPRERLGFAMAGGAAALLHAVEGAEDSIENGAARIQELGVGAGDVVIGLAASGATPFVIGAIEAARKAGALTIGLASTPASRLLELSDHPILLDSGAEPIAGSTRFKAGTAQKVALNLFSTLLMIRLGRVYRGLMVRMRPTNAKLRRRAEQMVMTITGCDNAAAANALAKAQGDVRLAALLASGVEETAAAGLLEKHGGNLRRAIADAAPAKPV